MDNDIEPTEEISINKDQADCLLIVLTQHYELINMRLDDVKKPEKVVEIKDYLIGQGLSPEDVDKHMEEAQALDESLKATIPTILSEIKEIYPMLADRSNPASRIIMPEPTWKKK